MPVLFLPLAGPTQVSLIFRVGRADEAAFDTGICHLIEHLALSGVGESVYQFNGAVDALTTRFVARGTPDEMAEFLRSVCESLGDLPLERVADEARILITEAATHRRSSTSSRLAWLRMGYRGLGSLALPELFLDSPDPRLIADWVGHRFVAENAVLCIVGQLPDDLELPLGHGSRQRELEIRPIEGLRLPSIVWGPSGAVSASFVVDRAPATTVGFRVAAARLRQDLRGDRGLSYEASILDEPVSATRSHVTLLATCLDSHSVEVQTSLLRVIEGLGETGPTKAEITGDVAVTRRASSDPITFMGRLEREALDELLGSAPTSFLEREMIATEVRPTTVANAMRIAFSSMLLVTPSGTVPGGRFYPYPGPVPGALGESRVFDHSTKRSRFGRTPVPRLVVGSDGVGIDGPDGRRLSAVVWKDCVAVVPLDDGTRILYGSDGYRLDVVPSSWRHGDEAVALVDRHAPAGLVLPSRRSAPDQSGSSSAVENGDREASFGPNSPWVREFLAIAASLTDDEAGRVRETATRIGLGVSTESSTAIAMMLSVALMLERGDQQKRAKQAANEAVAQRPATRPTDPILGYAAGVMAEAFVVRDGLDPKSWRYVSEPWRTIFEVPPLYEGEMPEPIARAEALRAYLETD